MKTELLWLNYLARSFVGRRRYRGVTPPSAKRQRVRDRHDGSMLEFRIRDDDDWIQIEHIFLNDGFDLTDSGRIVQMRARYDAILASGGKPLIVDLGANIGLASAYFHRLYPDATIVAVEPDAGNCAVARDNLPPGAILMEAAISSVPGRASLRATGRNCGFQVEPGEVGDIAMVTMADVLAKAPDATPFLIKIDIEGYEEDLFAANLDWLDAFPVLLIELHDWMLPGRRVTRNFVRAIADRERDLMHFGGFVLSTTVDL